MRATAVLERQAVNIRAALERLREGPKDNGDGDEPVISTVNSFSFGRPTNGNGAAKPGTAKPSGGARRKVYDFLLANPGVGYRELCEGHYGEYDDTTYNRVRKLIRALKVSGWLDGEPGRWRLMDGEGHYLDGGSA